MRRGLIIAHTTGTDRVSAILANGLRGGKGGHDRAGAGAYANVFSIRDLELTRERKIWNAAAVAESRKHGQRKYGPHMATLIYGYCGDSVLNLSDRPIHDAFIAFSNELLKKRDAAGIVVGPDENDLRPWLHLRVETFRRVVAQIAGHPVDAVFGQFADPKAPRELGQDPKLAVIRYVPEELCLNTNAGLTYLGRVEDAKPEWGEAQRLTSYFDYEHAAKNAAHMLRSMSNRNFNALVRSALQAGDQADRMVAPQASSIQLVVSAAFKKKNNGYYQLLQDNIEAIAKELGCPNSTIYVDPTFTAETNRAWVRDLRDSDQSLVIVLDGNQTVSGMAHRASDAGAPCLAIVQSAADVDNALFGRTNLVMLRLALNQNAEAADRERLRSAVMGFLAPEWLVVDEQCVTDALVRALVAARKRLPCQDGISRKGMSHKDAVAVAKAIVQMKRAKGEAVIVDQLELFK